MESVIRWWCLYQPSSYITLPCSGGDAAEEADFPDSLKDLLFACGIILDYEEAVEWWWYDDVMTTTIDHKVSNAPTFLYKSVM